MARPAAILAAILWGVSLVPIWALDYFPGQDTPNHLYAVHVRMHLEDPAFAAHFAAEETATTNIGLPRLLGAVALTLGLETSHRLFLSLYLLAFLLGALYLAGSVRRERWPLGLLVYPFAFQWSLTMGFYNFCVTVPLFSFGLGLLLRQPVPRPRDLAALLLLSLLGAAFHPLFLGCLTAAGLVVARGLRNRLRVGLALVPAFGLVFWGMEGVVVGALEWPEGFPSPLYTIATSFYRFALPIGPQEAPAGAAAFLLLLGPGLWTAWRDRGGAPDPARRATLALLLLLFLLPERSFGRNHISTRVVVFVALLVPVWADYSWLVARRRLFLGLVAVVSLASTGLFLRAARAVNDDLAEYTAGRSAVARGATLLPLNFDGRCGTRVIWPLLHAWAYYGIERNAVAPYLFNVRGGRPASLLRLRSPSALEAPDEALPERLESGAFCEAMQAAWGAGVDCAALREQAYAELVRLACRYDQVLTWAAPPRVAERLSVCFEPAFSGGRLVVYRKPRPGARAASPGGVPRSGGVALLPGAKSLNGLSFSQGLLSPRFSASPVIGTKRTARSVSSRKPSAVRV
jgi:hypothetical protein